MALSESAKVSMAFKKLIGVEHRYSSNQWYNECPDKTLTVYKNAVMVNSIPSSPPAATTDTIKVYTTAGDGDITMCADNTISNNRGWRANDAGALRNFVHPKFGSGYTVRVFNDDGAGGKGAEIFTTDSIEWFFDYENGYLSLENTPTGKTLPLHIEAYRYLGKFLDEYVELTALTTDPATPPSNTIRLYALQSGAVTKIKYIDSAGTSVQLGSGGGAANSVYIEEGATAVTDNAASNLFISYGSDQFDVTTASGTSVSITLSNPLRVGALNVTAALSVQTTMHVSGAVTLGSSLNVSGAVSLSSTLWISGASTFNGITNSGALTTGTLNVTANASVQGTFHASGATTFGSTVNISGATSISNTLWVCGAATFNGITNSGTFTTQSLDVTSNMSVGGTLWICGATTLNGLTVSGTVSIQTLNVTANVSVGGTLWICGATTLNGLTVSGNATVGNLSVTNNATVVGTLNVCGISTFSNHVVISGKLTVSGAVSLSGTLEVGGAANFSSAVSISNTLHVSGAATFGLTLNVSGATSISNTLWVCGNTTLNGLTVSGILTVSTLNVTANASVQGTLHVSGAATFGSTLQVSSQATFSNNVIISGTLTVTGNVSLSGTLRVASVADFGSSVSIGNTLYVCGSSTLCGGITVNGVSNFGAAVSISSTLNVSGAVTFGNNLTVCGTITVSGAVSLSSTLYVAGASTISALSSLGNISGAGTLYIAGASTLSALSTSGAMCAGGTFDVIGATKLCSSLTVSGTVILSSTLTVTGATSISGTLFVGGATLINSTLGVTGAATFHSTIAVSGTATFDSIVTINDNINISGNLTVCGNTTVNALSVTGAATVVGTFKVCGIVTFSSNLIVSGTLTVSGAVSLSSTLMVSDTIHAKNYMALGNTASLNVGMCLIIDHEFTALTAHYGAYIICKPNPGGADTTDKVGLGGFTSVRNTNVTGEVMGLQFGPYAFSVYGGATTTTTLIGIDTWGARGFGTNGGLRGNRAIGLRLRPFVDDGFSAATYTSVSVSTAISLLIADGTTLTGRGSSVITRNIGIYMDTPTLQGTGGTTNYQIVMSGSATAACGIWFNDTGGVHIGGLNTGTNAVTYISNMTVGSAANDMVMWDTVSHTLHYCAGASARIYKKDIRDFDDNWHAILNVQPKIFNKVKNNLEGIGYIAEDIEELGIEKLLIRFPDGKLKGLKYDKFTLYAIEVIKEQQKRIIGLEDEVTKMAKKVDTLVSFYKKIMGEK